MKQLQKDEIERDENMKKIDVNVTSSKEKVAESKLAGETLTKNLDPSSSVNTKKIVEGKEEEKESIATKTKEEPVTKSTQTPSPSKTSSKVSSSVQTMKAFLEGDDISVSSDNNTYTEKSNKKKGTEVGKDAKKEDIIDDEVVDSISKQILGKIDNVQSKTKAVSTPVVSANRQTQSSSTSPSTSTSNVTTLKIHGISDGPPVFPSSPSTMSSSASTPEQLSSTKWLDHNYPYLQRNPSTSNSGSEKDEGSKTVNSKVS